MARTLCIAVLIAMSCGAPRLTSAASTTIVTENEKRAAQKMFEAGDGLYEGGRYDEAAVAFKNSYDLVASPNSRLMLARSLREAGRYDEACVEFRATIHDAEVSFGRYPETLQAAESELKGLESSLLTAAQTADPNAATPQPIATSEREAQKPTIVPPLAPQAPPAAEKSNHASPLSIAAWTSAGVGAVGIATFGVFGYLNHKTYSDLEASCRSVCPTDSDSQIDRGRSYQLLGNIGLGIAVVGAATATTLFVLATKRGDSATSVAVRASPAGLMFHGGF